MPAPLGLLFPRRYDLDWLRIIAFGLLIFYHTGMFYVTWDWHEKRVNVSSSLEWAMMLLNPGASRFSSSFQASPCACR